MLRRGIRTCVDSNDYFSCLLCARCAHRILPTNTWLTWPRLAVRPLCQTHKPVGKVVGRLKSRCPRDLVHRSRPLCQNLGGRTALAKWSAANGRVRDRPVMSDAGVHESAPPFRLAEAPIESYFFFAPLCLCARLFWPCSAVGLSTSPTAFPPANCARAFHPANGKKLPHR
jgi:hypothetical protein